MIRLAILDDLLPSQLEEGGDDAHLSDMQVVWTGTDLDALLAHSAGRQPQVVVLNVDLADPEDPGSVVRQVKERSGAELVIALYSFLPRKDLDAVAAHGRPLRSPISLARLRSQMLGVLVRNFFSGAEAGSAPSAADAAPPERSPIRPLAQPASARFSRAQLAKLMEIESVVDCECPNHLGEIVAGLQSFEQYAARCESKNPKDAAVHRMLAEKTAGARVAMEEALQALIEHEGIRL